MMSNSASLNGGRDLVLDDLGARAVADHLTADLQRLDAAHVDAHTGEILQRAAAGRRLGVAVHDADLLTQLVDEHDDAVRAADRAGELAQRLAHQARDHADGRLAHLTLELAARQQRRHGVNDHDVKRAGAHELLRDLKRLLAGVRLGDEEAVDVHAEGAGIRGLERVLHVDERDLAAGLLGAGEDVQRERRLTGRLGAVDLDDAAAGHAADAEREVERQRPGGDGLHVHGDVVAEAHDGALAEVLFRSGRGRSRVLSSYPPA